MVRLRQSSPEDPGWTRRRAGRGFVHLDGSGERLSDDKTERIRVLAIPPAWEDVWICPHTNGHLQAVGTDEAGRRQYLYHAEWRVRRDREKYDRALRLGRVLPRVRTRTRRHLAGSDMTASRACALAVRLLDLGYFRIGSDAYTDEHGSFGLTTLERRHVRKVGGTYVFTFVGKSGVEHVIRIDDPASVRAISDLRRRKGGFEEILAFKDGQRWHRLTADLVNDYVRDVSGLEVTAKDFRTWHATVLAALALADQGEPGASRAAVRRQQVEAMKEVADYLGNTPAMARTSYVDPRVLEHHEQGRTIRVPTGRAGSVRWQEAAERSVARLLSRKP